VKEIQPRDTTRSLLLWLGFVVSIVALGLSIFAVIMAWRLESRIDNIAVEQRIDAFVNGADILTPDVGVIQFMKRGYTVRFDTLNYGPSGLDVTGTVGNPTWLYLSSINLKLVAMALPNERNEVRSLMRKDPALLKSNRLDVGSAETTVPSLNPGQTESFKMTIPNVKQTKDKLFIVISFSGERYSYVP